MTACLRVWGLDTHIEWSPLTSVPTNYWVSPNPHARQVGAKPTLLTLHPKRVGLFGMWRLGPPTPTVDFRRVQQPHILTSALFSTAPVRVLVLLPARHPVGALLHRAMLHTYSYSVTRGTYQGAQWTLWCLQNAAAAALRPVQHADLVNRVGLELKRWGFPLHPSPPHTTAPLTPQHYTVTGPTLSPMASSRRVFWCVRSREVQCQKAAMTNRNWRAACTQSYIRTNEVLQFAPCAWLRLLYSQADPRCMHDTQTPGSWVYGVWSAREGRVYYGQTGAIGGERTVNDRFQDEVQDSRALAKLYTSKGRCGPRYLRTMARLGPEFFCVVALRRVLRAIADGQEKSFIHNNPHNLNDKRPRWKPYMRWLLRYGLYAQLTDAALQHPQRWNTYITSKRLQLHPMDALRVLTHARGALPQGKCSQLQTRLLAYVQHRTGLHLPPRHKPEAPFHH